MLIFSKWTGIQTRPIEIQLRQHGSFESVSIIITILFLNIDNQLLL
jgi:hypothetical protein